MVALADEHQVVDGKFALLTNLVDSHSSGDLSANFVGILPQAILRALHRASVTGKQRQREVIECAGADAPAE